MSNHSDFHSCLYKKNPSISKFSISRCQISSILDSWRFWVFAKFLLWCSTTFGQFFKFRLCHRYRGPERADFIMMRAKFCTSSAVGCCFVLGCPKGLSCRPAMPTWGGGLFVVALRRRLALGTPKSALHPPPWYIHEYTSEETMKLVVFWLAVVLVSPARSLCAVPFWTADFQEKLFIFPNFFSFSCSGIFLLNGNLFFSRFYRTFSFLFQNVWAKHSTTHRTVLDPEPSPPTRCRIFLRDPRAPKRNHRW